uniref:NPC intracellular cholesterol transporter 2-like protein n=1 Tax=Pardosa astrigera TaxID=317848 RepID=A0AA96Y292_PARAW|nr:NPC intracellular cholesterol transporter 2-like protein [Pardosa astrigera]
MHLVGFLFLCFTLVAAKNINFETCEGIVKSVDVSPCSTDPCEIPKGDSVNITVRCISNVNAQKLRLSVFAEIAGIEVPYPGMRRDACKGKNLTCPITEGQEIAFVQSFPVKKFFPTISTVTRFNLKTNDDQDKNICCFKAPVKVVDAVR